MMKKNKYLRIIFLGLLVSGVVNSYAQEQWKTVSLPDFKNDMKKISEKMESVKSYSVAVSYLSYEKGKEELIHDRSSGFLKKDKNKFHSFVIGIHSIQDENERIEVDTLNKIIVIANPEKRNFDDMSMELSDLLLSKAKSLKKKESHGTVSYEVRFDQRMEISSYVLEVDNSLLLKKVDVVYNRKVKNHAGSDVELRMRLQFNEWNLNPAFGTADFSKDSYITKNKGQFVLMENYSNYKLLDQRVTN